MTGTVSGPETPTAERAGSAINDQHPECTPSTLFHQGNEKTVEVQVVAVTNTTKEITGNQMDLSCVVPSTSSRLEEQREPFANNELCGGNTTSETAVVAAEAVRGAANLEGSEFPSPPEVGDTDSAGQETTSQELLESEMRQRNTTESAVRTTMTSIEPQQKAPETQDLLGSSSKMKDSKTHAQVSNIHCISKKCPSCNVRLFGYIVVKAIRVNQQVYWPNVKRAKWNQTKQIFFL